MGNLNTGMEINKDLEAAVSKTVNSILNNVCTLECDLEDSVRNNLSNLRLSEKIKKCCNKNSCSIKRKDSVGFIPCYEEYYSNQANWVKNENWKWHTDILTDNMIAEIKIISKPSNCMCYLLGPHFKKNKSTGCTTRTLYHAVPLGNHFKDVSTSCIIDKPLGNLVKNRNYFSNLAEGQIWHDIIRLKMAENYFNSQNNKYEELYIILFCDDKNNNFNNAYSKILSVLNVLDTSYSAFLYHNGFKPGQVFRSPVYDFDYNISILKPGKSGYGAFLVKIK